MAGRLTTWEAQMLYATGSALPADVTGWNRVLFILGEAHE